MLAFICIVMSIKAIFAYLIPDIPSRVVIQLQRERYLARQAILQRNDQCPAPTESKKETKAEILEGDGPDPREHALEPKLTPHKAAAFEPPTMFDHIDADSSFEMKEKWIHPYDRRSNTSQKTQTTTTTFPVTPDNGSTYTARKMNLK